MRKTSLPLLAALSLGIACARTETALTGTEAALRAAIATYDSAWLAKDHSAIERILSPEYTYFTSTGGLSDKAATLAFLADSSYALTRSHRSDVGVKLTGSTAVISSRWQGEGRYRTEPVRDDQTCGQTWVWTAEAWLLMSEHCVNRPPAAPESA